MPKTPDDMEKTRAFDDRRRKERATLTENDERALAELRDATAKENGVPPESLTMIVCRRGARR